MEALKRNFICSMSNSLLKSFSVLKFISLNFSFNQSPKLLYWVKSSWVRRKIDRLVIFASTFNQPSHLFGWMDGHIVHNDIKKSFHLVMFILHVQSHLQKSQVMSNSSRFRPFISRVGLRRVFFFFFFSYRLESFLFWEAAWAFKHLSWPHLLMKLHQ